MIRKHCHLCRHALWLLRLHIGSHGLPSEIAHADEVHVTEVLVFQCTLMTCKTQECSIHFMDATKVYGTGMQGMQQYHEAHAKARDLLCRQG